VTRAERWQRTKDTVFALLFSAVIIAVCFL
jgi:hypothetical protein